MEQTQQPQSNGVPPEQQQQQQPMAQVAPQYVPQQNIPQSNVPQQLQHQAPRLEKGGNPQFWGVLSQVRDLNTGDYEKTEVADLDQYGVLLCKTVVVDKRPAIAMIMLPSTRLAKHINPQTNQPFVDERGNPLITIVNRSKI